MDQDPYGYYGHARERGDVFYEDQDKAWIASTYASVRQVFTDEDTFARVKPIEVVPSAKYVPIIGGEKHPSALVGQERLDHRKWWLGLFSRQAVESYRSGVVADIIDAQIDRIAPLGQAELVNDYTARVSIRVIAGVLGLPWSDDEWMSRLRKNLDLIEQYKSLAYLKPTEAMSMVDDALQATVDANELIEPFMERAREVDDGSIMAEIWRDTSLAGWTDEDRYGTVRTFFGAGSDTTRTAMANGLHILLTQPDVAERVRNADPAVVGNFVEEALRLHGTVHFRSRLVQNEAHIGDVEIAPGEKVVAIMAAAGRDPEQYPHPDEVDLDRVNPRSHMAFLAGVGTCAGAAIARVELQEGISRIITRLPDMALDPTAPSPNLDGLLFRIFRPLHVTFAPQT